MSRRSARASFPRWRSSCPLPARPGSSGSSSRGSMPRPSASPRGPEPLRPGPRTGLDGLALAGAFDRHGLAGHDGGRRALRARGRAGPARRARAASGRRCGCAAMSELLMLAPTRTEARALRRGAPEARVLRTGMGPRRARRAAERSAIARRRPSAGDRHRRLRRGARRRPARPARSWSPTRCSTVAEGPSVAECPGAGSLAGLLRRHGLAARVGRSSPCGAPATGRRGPSCGGPARSPSTWSRAGWHRGRPAARWSCSGRCSTRPRTSSGARRDRSRPARGDLRAERRGRCARARSGRRRSGRAACVWPPPAPPAPGSSGPSRSSSGPLTTTALRSTCASRSSTTAMSSPSSSAAGPSASTISTRCPMRRR